MSRYVLLDTYVTKAKYRGLDEMNSVSVLRQERARVLDRLQKSPIVPK